MAAWPAVSLVGSYELLVWLIRTSGTVERGPSAEHPGNRAACRTAVSSLPISSVDGDRPGESERHASDPTRRPAGQAAKLPTIPATEQRDDEVAEASTINDAAVAAYRLSVQAGNPLSERRLAQMFGRTSRRWARARIADARQALSIQESPGVPAMARLEALASELGAMASRRCATGERAWPGEQSGCGASVLRASPNQSPVTAVPASAIQHRSADWAVIVSSWL